MGNLLNLHLKKRSMNKSFNPKSKSQTLRNGLDTVYLLSGYLGAFCLFLLFIIVMIQMIGRWAGIPFPGATNYAGYAMAASFFLSLAYTFQHNAHIRVHFLLHITPKKVTHIVAFWCALCGALITTYMTWYFFRNVYLSYYFLDISQGQDATHLWIPQLTLAIGVLIFSVALWDRTLSVVIRMVRSHVEKSMPERERTSWIQ